MMSVCQCPLVSPVCSPQLGPRTRVWGIPSLAGWSCSEAVPIPISCHPLYPFPCHVGTGPKVLQPWLLGLTVVVVFLFVVFVVLIINRFWSLRKRRKQSDYPETKGTDRMERFSHDNPAAEDSDEESGGKKESNATSL
ncbi:small integral membrane protein 24 isoform X1 [Pipra filicauda]|uniref:Small integral membrane protein 24 isoform X1 n=1 Tax=Pipra filicauda TaxID=649802 RepID=A0A7R5KNC5_9PASS|nr:small integral membrane protein 24 isoform X1 [Pipra filicauda]